MPNIEQAEYKLTDKYSASPFSLPTRSLSVQNNTQLSALKNAIPFGSKHYTVCR